MDFLRETAFAKVNFGLRVLPVREDGFHNLESIFQTVNLKDELCVSADTAAGCTVICEDLQLPAKNTITSAYSAFCQCTDCEVPGIKVILKKGIPSGGGLGGGSSDGAALVRALEKLCNIELTFSQRNFIASETGSDVFFFIHCGKTGTGCAKVSGRGEFVEKIKGRKLNLVMIFPSVSSSTKQAYCLVDKVISSENDRDYPDFDRIEEFYCKCVKEWGFKNTFTAPLCKEYPQIENALQALRSVGADFADMSGSGSTVFGVFESLEEAEKAYTKLSVNYKCELVQTV